MRTSDSVTLVVKFWQEDDVWNGVAEDLPVAVFGETLDAAMANLREAVAEHMRNAQDLGLLPETIAHLRQSEAARHSLEDADVDEVFAKFPLPVYQDCHA